MSGYRRDRLREIVLSVFIGVMREERSVMIQHHRSTSEPDARREPQLSAARPASSRWFLVRRRVAGIVKVFRMAMRAINN